MMKGTFILQIVVPSTRGGRPFTDLPFEMVTMHFFELVTSLVVSEIVICDWKMLKSILL